MYRRPHRRKRALWAVRSSAVLDPDAPQSHGLRPPPSPLYLRSEQGDLHTVR
jgi:hypothetical protein